MDHDMPGMNMDGSGHDMGGAGGSNSFCVAGPNRSGRVMYGGFTFVKNAEVGGHGGGTCPLFLFQGAVVDTPGKYAGAIIGAFLLAAAMEGARHARAWLRRQRPALAKTRPVAFPILLEALLLGVHMLLAYLVMLLVMLYEAAIFIAILLGLTAAYFAFELLSEKYGPGSDPMDIGGGCCDQMAPAVTVARAVNAAPENGAERNGSHKV